MNREFILKYAPYIYFDLKEPFFPKNVGWTVMETAGRSESFPREIRIDSERIRRVIEYAIYWDFDIGHLYDLEHIWVYLDHQGQVADCEASFHGKYLKGLLRDGSNIEDQTHVRLYSQPGKHAFAPLRELFELLPDLETATWEEAGRDGLCVTGVAKGRYAADEQIDRMIREYLQKYRFRPSLEFKRYTIPAELFLPWPELDGKIPGYINAKLEEIRKGDYHELCRKYSGDR